MEQHLNEVDRIEKKRILAFFNHFVATNVEFLNRFSQICDGKLAEISKRVTKLTQAVEMLEAKLSNVDLPRENCAHEQKLSNKPETT